MSALPDPLAFDGTAKVDVLDRTITVAPAQHSGYGPLLYRRAYRQLEESEQRYDYWNAPSVYTKVAGGDVRGEPAGGGLLRFKVPVGQPGIAELAKARPLRSIITVDRRSGAILSVRLASQLGG